ncbi:MAG: nucleoside hydrolase [Lachnospiraceae bacterium]|nr:nucleoside hydrolase [Lachnospiraceae bacterium]
MEEKKRKLILDVDTGSDDAVAVLLSILSGRFDVLGITVSWGNSDVETCVNNTLQIVDMLGADIPVFQGCPGPMVREMTKGRVMNLPPNKISTTKDGKVYTMHPNVLPIPPAVSKKQEQHACAFLMEAIKKSPEKVTVIPTAPMTNIGMALRMDPSLVENIEEIVLMGGAVHMGNASPSAEANFFHDPEAAKIVLDSGAKIRIVPLNATHSAGLYREDAAKLIGLGTMAGKLAGDLVNMRLDSSDIMGWRSDQGEPIHDALAVAWALDESVIVESREEKCDVEMNGGICDGTMVVDHRRGYEFVPNARVAYRGDRKRFMEILCEHLSKGPKAADV